MAKRLRKVFIVCEDNQIFPCKSNVMVYKSREDAERICKREQEKAKEEMNKMWNANKPLPKFKVHAFYLVHEDMFRD